MDENLLMQMSALEDEMRGKYLIFLVEKGEYGIEIRYIIEIINVQDITPVPHTHGYLKGIINLRGTVVPVIDTRLRFGLPEIPYTERTCIVVLSLEEMTIGLIVDEVLEVAHIKDEGIQPPPKLPNQGGNSFILALGAAQSGVKQLLDIDKVFDTELHALTPAP